MASTILIVDDEKNIRSSLARSLSLEGYETVDAGTAQGGMDAVVREAVDLVMLDVRLPDGNGLEVLDWIKARRPELPVIIMSGHGSIDMAMEAIRKGAEDFIEKPLSTEKILITLGNTLRLAGHKGELETLRARLPESSELLGESASMRGLREMIAMAAPTHGRVLVTGESGTGKELIARAIHRGSPRSEGAFIKLNCAAIPSELIESELFGHERGAFTGATHARKGKFELAHRGTLFLDEIGDMRLDVQAKLLRALQEGEIERVGGSRTIRVDVRVIAATNKELPTEIEEGRFRDDLYYRLNVVPLVAPPLRERKSDVPLLARRFVQAAALEHGLRAKVLTDEALAVLGEHDWPGNVRELKNACERLIILTPGDRIDGSAARRLLGATQTLGGSMYRPGQTLKEAVAEAERAIVTGALEAHDGHVTHTAAALGLERSHLYKKMRALGMQRDGGAS
ncbi:MAG: sigma-54-dependent transcriptional regulator [Myxococcota bacterium]